MKTTYPESLEWLPDWTDANQYPPVTGTTGTQWAWEFLRRNPEYRDAYSKLTHVTCMEEFSRLFDTVERFRLIDGLYPPDPASSGDPRLSFRARWIRRYEYSERHPEQTIPISPGKILIELDLSLPVGPQLEYIRGIFRKGAARYKVQNLADYLRILDAKVDLSEHTYSRIAETIFHKLAGEEKITKDHPLAERVKESYKVALNLRDSDYWKLVPLA